MSDEMDVEAIRARADATTPGPWSVVLGDTIVAGATNVTRGSASYRQKIAALDDYDYELDDDENDDEEPASLTADAEFIAHAREDVPALLAALAAAEQRADTLAAAIQRVERVAETFDNWEVPTVNTEYAAAEIFAAVAVSSRRPSPSGYEYRVMCHPPGREVRKWSSTRTDLVAILHDLADCEAEDRWGPAWIERRPLPPPWERQPTPSEFPADADMGSALSSRPVQPESQDRSGVTGN